MNLIKTTDVKVILVFLLVFWGYEIFIRRGEHYDPNN
jgi:hypothetical protein